MKFETKCKLKIIVLTVAVLCVVAYGFISGSVLIIVFGIASALYGSFTLGKIYGAERLIKITREVLTAEEDKK
jgi:hypothetical protein